LKISSHCNTFLKPIDQIIGSDLQKYGPFDAEDVATLPFENALALISKKIAVKNKAGKTRNYT